MSVVIVAFPSAPKVDAEAVQKETELNSIIEKKVTGEKFWATLFSFVTSSSVMWFAI